MRVRGERITITFPEELAKELRDSVPQGERSRFIVEATREKLRRWKQEKESGEKAEEQTEKGELEPLPMDDLASLLRGLRKTTKKQIDRLLKED